MENPVADPAKVKRYTRLTIVCAFLLALLWPVGGYFFWIFGGFIAYFLFLIWYYSPRQQREESRATWSRPNRAGASQPASIGKKIRMFVIVFVAFFFIVFVFLLVVGLIVGDPNEETSLDVNTEQTFNPESIDDLTNRGNDFYNQAQYDSALKYYDRVLELAPDNQYALYNKSLVYHSKQEYRLAIALARRCINLYPEYGYAYYLLGDEYNAVSKPDSALVCYEQAYNLEVRDFDLLKNLGDAYANKNNSANAVRYYKEAIGQDSTQVAVYQQLLLLDRNNAPWYQQQIDRYSN